ncbi:MAG TPA: 30S ribosomal protein S18 [Chloroflexi bacterium]|nr:30S ribosomal protein S18 [Chloroflexota bacterium]
MDEATANESQTSESPAETSTPAAAPSQEAPRSSEARRSERPRRGNRRFRRRSRARSFYIEKVGDATHFDYKDYELLRLFLTDRGKIRPRRQTGVTAKQQRALAKAIKRARHMALLPFTSEHIRENQ